ncbi:MAG: hydrogenase 3 maturation endopeptidase HyCI [Phycisphaerales bacterium]|nr:MAG: hydrogenase 3 maturation endopeptidase HyCI [Phycisphaerales bacterium]
MGADRQLLEQLDELRGSHTLILGIGNTLKGDDGAGPLVCAELKRLNVSADFIDVGTVPENYIQTIIKKGSRNLLIVDAMDFGAAPGTIKILDPGQLSAHAFSTHTLSPRLFVEMIRRQLKADVYFVGIQPAQTQFGQTVSRHVGEAVRRLGCVLAEIFGPK